MTDRGILEKYINLEMSCLNKEEKVEVMDMLYKYKEAFSLRDEIGTCPNIEVEIEVTDKSPFFIRPYHVREEDKVVMDKEMKRLCYMGILKEGFSAYSSPVMLISRKLTKVHKFLLKQVDIDKILHIIQRKVLKNTHLPIEIKEIQAGYLHNPYFKDLYQYLLQNKLPHLKLAIKKLEALSERYVLLDSLLFRINPEKETAVLAIPEECVDKIITLYHKSLFAGHQGVIKCI